MGYVNPRCISGGKIANFNIIQMTSGATAATFHSGRKGYGPGVGYKHTSTQKLADYSSSRGISSSLRQTSTAPFSDIQMARTIGRLSSTMVGV